MIAVEQCADFQRVSADAERRLKEYRDRLKQRPDRKSGHMPTLEVRIAAAGKRTKQGRNGGAITRDMMREWLHREGVVLRGGGPARGWSCAGVAWAKRRKHIGWLPDVLRAQGDTIRILHRLRPLGVAMARGDEG